jgi:hypothetical protein
MQKFVFTIAALAAATVGLSTVSQAASTTPAVTSPTATKVFIPVVSGAVALSTVEKGSVDGMCGCPPPPPPPTCPPPAPVDAKPGYGFGTTGHYGPPGQGFTPGNSWRGVVAAGGTTTPKGGNLPPRAFR